MLKDHRSRRYLQNAHRVIFNKICKEFKLRCQCSCVRQMTGTLGSEIISALRHGRLFFLTQSLYTITACRVSATELVVVSAVHVVAIVRIGNSRLWLRKADNRYKLSIQRMGVVEAGVMMPYGDQYQVRGRMPQTAHCTRGSFLSYSTSILCEHIHMESWGFTVQHLRCG